MQEAVARQPQVAWQGVSDDGAALQMATVEGSVSAGYTATLRVAV